MSLLSFARATGAQLASQNACLSGVAAPTSGTEMALQDLVRLSREAGPHGQGGATAPSTSAMSLSFTPWARRSLDGNAAQGSEAVPATEGNDAGGGRGGARPQAKVEDSIRVSVAVEGVSHGLARALEGLQAGGGAAATAPSSLAPLDEERVLGPQEMFRVPDPATDPTRIQRQRR